MIHILMPAFNEEEGLEKLLQRIKVVMEYEQYDYMVYVINDGSSDRTEYVLKCYSCLMPIHFETLLQNSGITVVFQILFRYVIAVARDEDIIIALDSDNTQSPYVMIDLIKAIKSGHDLAIASRFVPHSRMVGVPWFRNMLSNGVAFLLGILFPYEGVKDYSTFYRAYRALMLKKACEVMMIEELIKGHGFSSMASFLLKICYIYKPKVKEVPVNLRYDLKEGGSKIKIFKTTFGYLRMIRELWQIKKSLA